MNRLRKFIAVWRDLHLFHNLDPNQKRRNLYPGLYVEKEKIETALYFETLLSDHYELIAEIIHNGRVRVQCQTFLKESKVIQKMLICFLEDPEMSLKHIEQIRKNTLAADPAHLSILGSIKIALEATKKKLLIYRYIGRVSYGPVVDVFISKAIDRTCREIRFFKEEQGYQEQKDAKIIFS